MFMKKFSHLLKTRKARNGTAFAVLGYPRSGTTMMSEIVGMVTDYYFDRDNIFPSSSKVVLHTHWNPVLYAPENSLYIIRNPVDVHLSLVEYANAQDWSAPGESALKSRKFSKMSWLEHCSRAREAGHHVVDYDRIVRGDPDETERLAAHLSLPADWITQAMALLGARHAYKPHASDVKFRHEKQKRNSDKTAELRRYLETAIADEIALYRAVLSKE